MQGSVRSGLKFDVPLAGWSSPKPAQSQPGAKPRASQPRGSREAATIYRILESDPEVLCFSEYPSSAMAYSVCDSGVIHLAMRLLLHITGITWASSTVSRCLPRFEKKLHSIDGAERQPEVDFLYRKFFQEASGWPSMLRGAASMRRLR